MRCDKCKKEIKEGMTEFDGEYRPITDEADLSYIDQVWCKECFGELEARAEVEAENYEEDLINNE